jgi:hypothetical protein
MRQPTKPFIVERMPSRRPKLDEHKPSIWGSLDADIAQGLKDQREMDQQAAPSVTTAPDTAPPMPPRPSALWPAAGYAEN